MARRVKKYRSRWPENPLWHFTEFVPLSKVVRNYVKLWVARKLWSMPLKNRIYRSMGAKIGENVAFGLESTMELFFPELVEVGDNCVIGYNATILTHEILVDHWRVGKVKIGKNCMIGANATILPGVEIADNTIVAAGALVNSDVSGIVGGVPARPLKRKMDEDGQ